MKKLKLEFDDLAVESFDLVADRHGSGVGTVHGRYTNYWTECGDGCVTMAGFDCGTRYDTDCGTDPCAAASMKADPWGCTVGDSCDNCGATNMVDCSWGMQCTINEQ